MILGIDHIGIAVRDASAASGIFADVLAQVASHVEVVAGQAVRVAFVPVAWSTHAGARIEIVAPDDPSHSQGTVARFLEKRGEGLHHICFLTDDIDFEIARLSPRYAMVDRAPRRGHGGRVAFLHPRGLHGVLVELIERDVETRDDAPTRVPVGMGDALGDEALAAAESSEWGRATRLLAAARMGDRRALARALTAVEAGGEAGRAVMEAASQVESGPMTVVGITGAPGAGKSTLVGVLARTWRDADPDVQIAVLAIDPSSPVTGGAVLGDRVRMGSVAGDDGVFVRSLAGRGSGDGLADAASDMIAVLRATGFGTVLLETVGAGQDALAIGGLADVVVVVYAPGLGDSIQGLKSGLIDLADVIVVNKSDLDGAAAMASGLRFGRGDGPTCSVVETVSTTGVGILELRGAVLDAATRSRDPVARAQRAIGRAAAAVVRARVEAAITDPETGTELIRGVVTGQMSPTDAAYVILERTASRGVRRGGRTTTPNPLPADLRAGSQA
jgi:LAO/AO transport system kinase